MSRGSSLPSPRSAGLAALAVLGACSARPGRLSPAAGAASSFAAVLDTLVPARLARDSIPGVAVALVENGRIALAAGYGWADRDARRPMTDSTPIGVASVSKAVFSLGVLRLVQTGRLPLDAPTDSLVPGWRIPDSPFDSRGVTIRRLLSHTAGASMLSVPCFPADSARPTEVEVLNGEAGNRGRLELIAAPGERWSYSGGGFTLLQLAVQRVTGTELAEWIRGELFEPLGMRDSYYGAPTSVSSAGYDERGRAGRPSRCVGEAAAALVTTARDMARLLVEYGRARQGRSDLLSAAWIDSLATPVIKTEFVINGRPLDMGDTRMGLGHFLHTAAGGRRMLFHSGGNPGVGAYLLVDLDRDGGLFVALNSDRARPVMEAILSGWGKWNETDPPTFF